MFAFLAPARKSAAVVFALFSMVWLAACDPGGLNVGGPVINTSRPVQVALLVPGGSGDAGDAFLATNFENAARLAMADLEGVTIDLRVYNTAADAAQAASVATQAVNEGAKIILGPLYAESANAAGLAVANRGVNVLAFSNNASIAGGNVFVLGSTFQNTANRLARYAIGNSQDRVMVVHGDDLQGTVGRDAIVSAVQRNGGIIADVQSYPLSQQGIFGAGTVISSQARASGANAIFTTAGVNSDLPILATVLPGFGAGDAPIQHFGLTRWDTDPKALELTDLQGGIFAMPDTQMSALFDARYNTAFGSSPHPLAGLAFDGIAAIGALVAQGNTNALARDGLTQQQGFQGTAGIFRLLPNGTNERGLAVAQFQDKQVIILDPAPRSFAGGGGPV